MFTKLLKILSLSLLKILSLSFIIVMLGCSGAPVKSEPASIKSIPVSITVNDQECTQVEDKIKGSEPEISALSYIDNGEGYVKIFSGLSVSDVTRVWNDLNIMLNAQIMNVNVFLNSGGGDAFTGIALARYLDDFSQKGMIIRIYASGIVASAAIPVLAVGDERHALPGTIFMVHEAALWKWPGRETASDIRSIRSQNELMNLLRDSYMDILVLHTKTPRKTWEDMEGRTTWFDVKKAKELNLVD
jgi:ATP-dependent protease ClpP protease subunit